MSKNLYKIPLLNLGSKWSETVAIKNRLYRLHFNWNTNCKYWELDITDDNNILIVGGIRVVTIATLTDEYKYLLDFDLYVVPITDKVEITLDNFATDFEMVVQVEEDK